MFNFFFSAYESGLRNGHRFLNAILEKQQQRKDLWITVLHCAKKLYQDFTIAVNKLVIIMHEYGNEVLRQSWRNL